MTDNFFGTTDLGRQRQNNEDAYIAQPAADGRFIIACVIDGVGGYSGGEVAAAIARDTIIQQLDNTKGDITPALKEALIIANSKILIESQSSASHKSMACVLTLAVADLENNQFHYAHIGDTRMYLFRDGSLVKITQDHSFVGFLEDSGRLQESEAMRHPKRNEIDKALGFKADISATDYIETGQSPFLPGDMLLLCSDGLTDLVDKAAITRILSRHDSLEIIGLELIDEANNNGGKDNITVALVKNDKSKQQHTATKPAETAKPVVPEPAIKKNAEPEIVTRQPKQVKTYKGIAAFLLIVAIALAGVCVWQFLKTKTTADQPAVKDTVAKVKTPNPQEVKLQALINQSKGRMIILADTAFKSPLVISRSIQIDRDSLHIKVKGNLVLQSDSGFKYPAFAVSAKVKVVVLDSLTFQNFAVAVSGHDQAVQLKNTRFINCVVPIENSYAVSPGKAISGNAGTATFKTDSSTQKKKK